MTPDMTQDRKDLAKAGLVCGIVGFALDVSAQELLDTRRGPAAIAFARQIAMYLTHISFSISLARVANAFARDRSTVAYACQLVENRREDVEFDLWMYALESATLSAPAPNFADSGDSMAC